MALVCSCLSTPAALSLELMHISAKLQSLLSSVLTTNWHLPCTPPRIKSCVAAAGDLQHPTPYKWRAVIKHSALQAGTGREIFRYIFRSWVQLSPFVVYRNTENLLTTVPVTGKSRKLEKLVLSCMHSLTKISFVLTCFFGAVLRAMFPGLQLILPLIQLQSLSHLFAICGLQHARLSCPSPTPSLLKLMSIQWMVKLNSPFSHVFKTPRMWITPASRCLCCALWQNTLVL